MIFHLCRRMVELDDRLAGVLQVFQDRLYHPASDSVLEALPGDWRALQGRNPSAVICDEVHVMDPDVWDALSLAGGTRARPLILGVSTECDDDPDNLMARLVEHGRYAEDPSFYFIEYTAPPGCDVNDRQAWSAANPQLGDTLDPEHLAAMVKTTREQRFRRFHLNQRVTLDGAWLPVGAWEACQDSGRTPLDGDLVVIGLDGSFSSDCTALVVVTVDQPSHVHLLELWEPAPGGDDRVPVADVEEAVRQACRRWDVLEITANPFRCQRSLQALEAERLPVTEFPQSPARMAPATSRFYTAVVEGDLTHGGDPRMARHVRNAVLREDARGSRLTKESKASTRRIDACVAAVMALERASHHRTRRYDVLQSFI